MGMACSCAPLGSVTLSLCPERGVTWPPWPPWLLPSCCLRHAVVFTHPFPRLCSGEAGCPGWVLGMQTCGAVALPGYYWRGTPGSEGGLRVAGEWRTGARARAAALGPDRRAVSTLCGHVTEPYVDCSPGKHRARGDHCAVLRTRLSVVQVK